VAGARGEDVGDAPDASERPALAVAAIDPRLVRRTEGAQLGLQVPERFARASGVVGGEGGAAVPRTEAEADDPGRAGIAGADAGGRGGAGDLGVDAGPRVQERAAAGDEVRLVAPVPADAGGGGVDEAVEEGGPGGGGAEEPGAGRGRGGDGMTPEPAGEAGPGPGGAGGDGVSAGVGAQVRGEFGRGGVPPLAVTLHRPEDDGLEIAGALGADAAGAGASAPRREGGGRA